MCIPKGEFKVTAQDRILFNIVVAYRNEPSPAELSCEITGIRGSDVLELDTPSVSDAIETSIGVQFARAEAGDEELRFDCMRVILDLPLEAAQELLGSLHLRTNVAISKHAQLPYAAQERCVGIVKAVCEQLCHYTSDVTDSWIDMPLDATALNPFVEPLV